MQTQQVKEDAIRTLSYAMTYAKMGSWRLDTLTGELALSREFKSLLAMDEEDPEKITLENFLNLYIVPEDYNLVSDELSKAFSTKKTPGTKRPSPAASSPSRGGCATSPSKGKS